MANVEDLARAVKMYLASEIGFDEFEVLFSEVWLNLIPDGVLDTSALDQYGQVNEKLMWTSPSPFPEERSAGWIDRSEFRAWLTEVFKSD